MPSKPNAIHAAAVIVALFAALAVGCENGGDGSYQGYAEGEFVYVASKIGGRLDELPVKRGDVVKPGDLLFVLEHQYETDAVKMAEAEVLKAEDNLRDKQKGLRPDELDEIKASLDRAKVTAGLSGLELDRRKRLYKEQTIAKEELDQVSTTNAQDLAAIRELEAKLATGNLPSRIDQVLAAEKDVLAAKAALAQAQWNLDQKRQNAVVAGVVFDLLHYKGEWTAAGSPVISMLPPENVKVRFFVPEAVAGAMRVGEKVRINWDGAASPAQAEISYIAPQVEYAPPVIYSQDFRQKLVIMVEARSSPEIARRLNPGQPVDVYLEPGKPSEKAQ